MLFEQLACLARGTIISPNLIAFPFDAIITMSFWEGNVYPPEKIPRVGDDTADIETSVVVRSPKSTLSPKVWISTYWIVFVLLGDPPPVGAYPPAHIPRVDDEVAATAFLSTLKSPKVIVLPSDAIVIYSITKLGLL